MEIIEQVRQASSIVEIASQYTTLRRRGRKHVGLCPFHSEKTPSFTVDEEKQLFHCFGCGVGGDVFSLVMEKENLGFAEALRYLAEKYRIPLPQHRVDPQVIKLEEKLFKINEMALAFFRRNLFQTPEGKKALEYLKKRGLAEATIETLKIGYAMDDWGALIAYLRTKNVPATLLEKAGLALPGKKKDEYYDRFRGRVIFPIFSLTGKVVAFGGRTVTGAEPKYLNSPDTPLYSKGKLLYGLNISKDAIREAGEVILVEGYTDFAALFQAGIGNVVASLGTALTPFQVAQAARFTPRLIVNYDGDAAGKNACARAIPLCLEKGMNVDALILPEGLDPDAYLAKHGRDRYLGLLKKSLPGLDFLIDTYVPGRPDGRCPRKRPVSSGPSSRRSRRSRTPSPAANTSVRPASVSASMRRRSGASSAPAARPRARGRHLPLFRRENGSSRSSSRTRRSPPTSSKRSGRGISGACGANPYSASSGTASGTAWIGISRT